jgi:hypothetical protein
MTKKVFIFFFKMILSAGLFIGLQQLIELRTRGFCLQKILADDLPFQAKWQTPALSIEEERDVNALLSQSYRMIGAGSECFAFVSEDKKAVIKFFKLDHARPVYLHQGIFIEDHSKLAGTLSNHPLTRLKLPSVMNQWLKRCLGMREFRIQRTFNSLKLAHDELKEQTGLIYLHLNPTDHLRRELTIYDACGIPHKVELDKAKFFLQKCATPLSAHFAALKAREACEDAKKSIDSLIGLILLRCQKGFSDRDFINRNLGYIGNQAIEIDSGSFLKNPRMQQPWIYKQELFYATLELKNWLRKNYPEMASYLEDRVTEEIYQNG